MLSNSREEVPSTDFGAKVQSEERNMLIECSILSNKYSKVSALMTLVFVVYLCIQLMAEELAALSLTI